MQHKQIAKQTRMYTCDFCKHYFFIHSAWIMNATRLTYMYNQQSVDKPSAAYYCTLIGGILGILLGVVLIFVLIGIWIIVANALMIMFAQRLMAQPEEHQKYGIYIIVLSVLSLLNVITLIGGILALTHQPVQATPQYQPIYPQNQPTYQQPPYSQPVDEATTKYCPQCGNPVGGEAQFCPKCGKKLPS